MRYLKFAIALFTTILVLTIVGITLYFSFFTISKQSDIILIDLTFSNSSPLENESIYITIKTINKGESSQSAFIYLYANEILIYQEEIFFTSGKYKELTIEKKFFSGNYLIKAKIIPKNIFLEKNNLNKTIEKQLKVFPLKIDLTPSLINFSTNTPEINQTIKITAMISNIGGIKAENVSFEVYNEDFLLERGIIAKIEGKNGKEVINVNFTPKNIGINRIRVYVNTSLIEENTSNNELVQTIIVYSQLPKVDFAIFSDDIFLENGVEKYNSTIKAKIYNIGNRTENAKIQFFADDLLIKEVNKTILQKFFDEVKINWIPNSSKFYNISIIIQNIEDINNENNKASKYFYVKTMPDIVVENITLKKDIKEDEIINILIELYNSGEGDAEDFLLEVKEDWNTFYKEKVSLKGKERKIISILWIAKSEVNKIEVVVNSDNSLIESKEDNNIFSIEVSVEKKAEYYFLYAIPIIIFLFLFAFLYLKTKKKPIFSVEEVFLIYRDGRLISHRGKGSIDDTLVSSMLTAIQDFVKDSFKAKGKIDEIQYGKERILIQHPPYDDYFSYVYLAVLINGREDANFKREMMSLVVKIHKQYSEILKNWDGDLSKLNELDLIVKKFIKKFGL